MRNRPSGWLSHLRWRPSTIAQIFGCVLLLGYQGTAAAQRIPPQLALGSRVRVTLPDVSPPLLIGTLVSARSDSLTVVTSDTLSVPIGKIQKIEISQGKKRQWKKGIAIGALAGIGFSATMVATSKGGREWLDASASIVAATGFAGALWGGVIGSAFKRERWEKIPINEPLSTPTLP